MRVALYARVSTEEQALHGLSIEAQLASLKEAFPNGKEYVDLGISARKPISKRPEMQRLLSDVEQGKIDLICFCKLDRWTRNIREYYKAQDILDAHNVAWKALHEDYETQTAAGRLKVNIMLAVAQDEADRTSERIKAVFDQKRKKGLVVSGTVPIGLKVVDGHLEPTEDAVKVKEAFQYYINTRSVYALTSASKEILGKSYSSTGIRSLLVNERYLEAGVIQLDMWSRAQDILSVRAVRNARTGRVYLFSGLLVCPECGAKMIVRCVKKGDKEYVYYQCSRAATARSCTYRKMVREDEVENFLKKRVAKEIDGYNLKVQKAKKKQVDVAGLQKKLDRLTDLYADGVIDREEFDRRSEPVRDLLKTAKAEPQEVDPSVVLSVMDAYESLQRVNKKAFWSNIFKSVTPTEDGFSLTLSLPKV